MTTVTFPPPFDAPGDVVERLRTQGHTVVDGRATSRLVDATVSDLDALTGTWNDLPPTPT